MQNYIVEQLKLRMKGRGDTGQIQRAEELKVEIAAIKQDMQGLKDGLSAILDNLGVDAPPTLQMRR